MALMLGACATSPAEPGSFKALAVPSSEFACGGALEEATWELWEQYGLSFLRQSMVAGHLQKRGNVNALYEMQVFFHNLAALAQRCQRPERMRQMADALMPVFDMLEPLPDDNGQRAWMCRGGLSCNPRSPLAKSEIMLASVQGLGLMSSLAEMMATSSDPVTRHHPFVAVTAAVSAEHLLRWGDGKMRADWRRLVQSQPIDVKDSSAALLFTDKPLWMIALYANLAGIYAEQPDLASTLSLAQRQALADALRDALALFKARTALRILPRSERDGGSEAAEIDSGYWRLYDADNRYAGYDGATAPALCTKQPDGSRNAQLMVDARDVPKVSGLGWDFSHARRLVYVLAALEQSRKAVKQVFTLTDDELPVPGLSRAFAAQLVGNIWNGDRSHPLFANYWSGANGWFRVAYSNGTGYCNAGSAPFGLSDSFVTGGYATWAQYYPVIGELGRALYHMAESGSESDKAFIRKYYRGLLSPSDKKLTALMFWPTLIE
jgi:hypothetical protein